MPTVVLNTPCPHCQQHAAVTITISAQRPVAELPLTRDLLQRFTKAQAHALAREIESVGWLKPGGPLDLLYTDLRTYLRQE